jgi:hypothetical protein
MREFLKICFENILWTIETAAMKTLGLLWVTIKRLSTFIIAGIIFLLYQQCIWAVGMATGEYLTDANPTGTELVAWIIWIPGFIFGLHRLWHGARLIEPAGSVGLFVIFGELNENMPKELTLSNGWHHRMIWFIEIVELDVRPRYAELGFVGDDKEPVGGTFQSQDGPEVTFHAGAPYKIHNPYKYAHFERGFVPKMVERIIGEFLNSYANTHSIKDIRKINKIELSKALCEATKDASAKYDIEIIESGPFITDIDFPKDLQRSFEEEARTEAQNRGKKIRIEAAAEGNKELMKSGMSQDAASAITAEVFDLGKPVNLEKKTFSIEGLPEAIKALGGILLEVFKKDKRLEDRNGQDNSNQPK